MKFNLKTIIPVILLLILILSGLSWLYFEDNSSSYSLHEGYHIHADFAVILNSERVNFSKEEYMDIGENIHLHDMNPDVVHYHKENLSMIDFFNNLNMTLNSTCFGYYDEAFCNNQTHSLLMVVNGNFTENFDYVPNDLDRILIYYGNQGNETIMNYFQENVTDKACIYSEKCPERGTAPPEECGGDSCIVNIFE